MCVVKWGVGRVSVVYLRSLELDNLGWFNCLLDSKRQIGAEPACPTHSVYDEGYHVRNPAIFTLGVIEGEEHSVLDVEVI